MMDRRHLITDREITPEVIRTSCINPGTILARAIQRTHMPVLRAVGKATATLRYPDRAGEPGAGIWAITTKTAGEALIACRDTADAKKHAASRAMAAAREQILRLTASPDRRPPVCLRTPHITIFEPTGGMA